jgi:L-Ala-D/L-Glu epimerase
MTAPIKLQATIESWPLTTPFRITGHTFDVMQLLVVRLDSQGHSGQGEAAGVYFRQESAPKMLEQIAGCRESIEAGITREALQKLLPPGGARNALDCALWDLDAKIRRMPVWELAGLPPPKPLMTTFGCGADSPERMASVAAGYTQARAIKLKLTGEPIDAERVQAVRAARPDVWLGVDANQGFRLTFLEQLMPTLLQSRVSLIEQPFPVGEDRWLDALDSPIPIAADETVLSFQDLSALHRRYQVVNIKLDKCGGLTEALAMARRLQEQGVECMVGNMIGTSLAMAPATLVGQLCKVVDLDGAIFLQSDRAVPVDYSNGFISAPTTVWGGSES